LPFSFSFLAFIRTCIHNVFALKNKINRQSFKEKMQMGSHSIKQVFDDERQDLAIFHAKANDCF
jgi:hypothetical protein